MIAEFEEPEDPAHKSFFSEIISSISDVRFSRDGRYIISRDYLTIKIWDINMENKPVRVIPVHEHLRSKLCDLYENDCIFDKFETMFSGDGTSCITGSYHNNFHIYDVNGKTDITLEASKNGTQSIMICGIRLSSFEQPLRRSRTRPSRALALAARRRTT